MTYIYILISKLLHPYFELPLKGFLTGMKEIVEGNINSYSITDTGVFQIYSDGFVYSYALKENIVKETFFLFLTLFAYIPKREIYRWLVTK